MTQKPGTSGDVGKPSGVVNKQAPNKDALSNHLQNKAADANENKNNLPATQDPAPKGLQEFLKKHENDFALVAPTHIKPDRLVRLGISACKRNPELLNCHMPTIVGGLLEAASLGLEVNSSLGEAYMVPFKNNNTRRTEAQLIIGYRGLVGLMLNHPKVESVFANVVYENDMFSYKYGINEDLHHIELEKGDRGEITHFYAYTKMSGAYRFVVLSKQKVDEHRDKFSQAYKAAVKSGSNDTPWISEYIAMGCKTAIRALERWIPKSSESSFHRAVDADYKVLDPFDSGQINIPDGAEVKSAS